MIDERPPDGPAWSAPPARVRSARLTRAELLSRALLAGLSLSALGVALGSCRQSTFGPSATVPSTFAVAAGESPALTLSLFNWPDNIDPSLPGLFRRRTDIALRQRTYRDNAELLAKLRAGARPDVVVPSDYMVQVLAREGLIRTLTMDAIPNFEFVQGAFRSPPYDPDQQGSKFSVPYQYGTVGMAVRKDTAPVAVSSWSDLWRPELKNSITFAVGSRAVLGVGLLSLGQSLNSVDDVQIRAAVRRLLSLRPNLARRDLTIQEGAPVTVCGSADAFLAMGQCEPGVVDWVLPKREGFQLIVDNLCVPTEAANPAAAQTFLDFCLDPVVQARLSSWLKSEPPEPEAVKALPSLLRRNALTDLELAHAEIALDQGDGSAIYDRAWATVRRAWGL
jgi:spermidine/putrescine-binding protein